MNGWGRGTSGLLGVVTSTDCSPLNTTCDPDPALYTSTYTVDFTKGADDDAWAKVAGTVNYTSAGAEFTVNKQGDSPTIQTSWYFFFGRVEVHMQAAPGQGIVSSAVLESDDLDEVDWEWLGGIDNQVQTDYFGKGNTTSYDRGGTTNLTDVQSITHNYTIDWSSERIIWYIDGSAIRTLNYADALDGANYPQTPMRVKLGIWAGGDPDNSKGTIEWAGGETDYTAGPYTMTVHNLTVYNANPGGSYIYGDKTGSYSSIEISKDNVTSTTSSATASSTSKSNKSTKSSSSTSSTSSSTSSSSGVTTSAGNSVLSQLTLLPGMLVALVAFYIL
ncbi:extracellular cell wall glucanase [Grosmannia clavigera kw1407]|uniref:chitinase n=1 Tax=Grosmannia clavigera (strain kw1407 / UAMH 11150) TaxID=655863 RepID=F0X7P2_GROCL|nr:extracellular cell wall glucanase [Grosmannia clavigera kw1407]EFX06548.1 extracellular cell wall glucanase [Grosmannia clavigera kw1407]